MLNNGLEEVASELKLKVLDSSGNEINRSPRWNFETLSGTQAEDINVLNSFIENGKNCTKIQLLSPFGLTMEYRLPDLKSEKLYSAVYYAVYKASPSADESSNEVHKYVFQTSKYKSFTEHIESYKLGASVNAFYSYEHAIPDTDLATGMEIIRNTMSNTHALMGQFADRYDRMINGALKLPAFEAAVSTEFNVIKNTETGKIIGLLIRSPEPFFDPKLPPDILSQSITVKDQAGNMLTTVIPKEPSRIFASTAMLDLTGNMFDIIFKYYLYDGESYQVVETVSVTIDISIL